MEFKVEKRENPNVKRYNKDELSIAYDFASKVHKEFGDMVKALILLEAPAGKAWENRETLTSSSYLTTLA